MIASVSLLPPQLHYTDCEQLNICIKTSLQKCNKASWKSAKGKVKGSGEQLDAAAAPLNGRRCHRDFMVSLSLPVPPRP